VQIGKVKSLIVSYALVWNVRFVLHWRGYRRLEWTIHATETSFVVAIQLFGKDSMNKYDRVEWSDEGLTIEGILPKINEGSLDVGS